jgi:hypothetical protein
MMRRATRVSNPVRKLIFTRALLPRQFRESARRDVAAHYAEFFAGNPTLTEQDQADIVAFLKLLD